MNGSQSGRVSRLKTIPGVNVGEKRKTNDS